MAQVKVSMPAITRPTVDAEDGKATGEWYRFFETLFNRTGGINGDRTGSVEVRTTALEDRVTADEAVIATKADKSITITAGNGLTGGPWTLAANFTIDAKKNTGWTAGTGTANKGAYATYTAPVISALYTQAEVQALADALQAATQRIKALEDAYRLNGGIDG